jgi:hypothetical protein
MPARWIPFFAFTTTALHGHSPDVELCPGLIVVEYTFVPGRRVPFLTLQIDHTNVGLEYHCWNIEDRHALPAGPVIGRRPLRILHPGPYYVGTHVEHITRTTVRLLRASS